MSTCLLMLSDGRDEYHDRALDSLKANLSRFDALVHVEDPNHEMGFAGAIRHGWEQVATTGCKWVFHFEADFTFNAPVPLDRLQAVLARHPELVQLVLKRQPWNEQEKATGGIVECHPDDFTQRTEHGDIWTEHRRFFSTNPSLYPAALCAQGWPQVEHSEGIFTHRLLEDPEARFAFWGGKYDPPLVHHIGDERKGTGY